MGELQAIRRVVARTRRRLRLQAALEGAATAAILAVAAALLILWCWRMELLSSSGATWALAGAGSFVVFGALLAAARRHPDARVAARLDRASGLSDRLGTALDFLHRVDAEANPERQGLMRAAIFDAVRVVPRADVRAAAPFRAPRDLRPLAAFVVVGAAVTALAFHPTRPPAPGALLAAARAPAAPEDKETLDPDDLDYQRQFVEDMKQLAEQTQDESLKQMARELKELLDQAAKGQITKQALLEKMDALEKKYSEGGAESLDKLLGGLKDQGQELKKNKVTQRLGEALEKGDMQAAEKELERLADEVEKGEMKPEDRQKLAEALDKAADKQEQRDKKDDQQQAKDAQKQIEKKQDEIRRLEKKVAENQNDEEAKRTLQKEKRELERLERDKKDQEERPKRQLDRLTRNMKNAAESLKQKNEEQQKQASQKMRQGAEDLKRAGEKMKQMQNQKRVQSQLQDLKDAIRRAKPRRGNGQQQMAERQRQQRISEWERRAGGLGGNPQAWRQGQGQNGQGQQGQGDGQNGQQGDQPGERWGTEHDPNLQDDPTKMDNARFENDKLAGVHGEGASRRETILTSAQKGFAQTSYRKVYAEYRKVVEEVMSQEKVPQGYKYYVKRYFQRIKPHSME